MTIIHAYTYAYHGFRLVLRSAITYQRDQN